MCGKTSPHEPALSTRRQVLYAIAAISTSVLACVLVLEIVLRFLPVNEGLAALPVNAENPVFHFTPNRDLTWSRDWNFSIVNQVRVNNAGYVNNQDYEVSEARPTMAIVGDSYVEAAMVPYLATVHGRLAERFGDAAHIYSFAASGAPLSQYLIWAKEAKDRWKATALAIVVVGNDFDESLAKYKTGPGFHHYISGGSGGLTLRRYDYQPTPLRPWIRMSALARYLIFNLNVLERINILLATTHLLSAPAKAQEFVGNTPAKADESRLRASRQAVDTFLKDLIGFAGWAPGEVLFLVDGIRYPSEDPELQQSYFVRMRNYFLAKARQVGFEAIDMDELFFAKHGADNSVFDFPSDSHWNGVAHGLAAQAVIDSAHFAGFRKLIEESSKN